MHFKLCWSLCQWAIPGGGGLGMTTVVVMFLSHSACFAVEEYGDVHGQ